MKKLAIAMSAVVLAAAAPLAGAYEAQLELLPKVGGAETTRYVSDAREAPAIGQANAFFYRHTGGVPPQ